MDGGILAAADPLFLHAGWEHFLFNSFALFQLGGLVEHFFGEGRFFWIYFGAGLFGTVASTLFQPDTVSVGASGAIFGLLGALLYFSIRRPQVAKGLFGRRLWGTLALNLVLGFVLPRIDYMGHLGGLIGGLLWAYALGFGEKGPDLRTLVMAGSSRVCNGFFYDKSGLHRPRTSGIFLWRPVELRWNNRITKKPSRL